MIPSTDLDRNEGSSPGRDFPSVQEPYTNFAARAAFITSSACPVTLTFRQAFSTFPSAPIKNVLRSIPIYFRPYIDFSTQVP
jgi:BarA-like signal transduction histidine kinase